MTRQPVEIVLTKEFKRQTKRARVPADKIREIVLALRISPESGDLVPGTGGARKIRFAGRGKGKSGGYRVISGIVTFDNGRALYLLAIYAKSDKVDLTQGEKRRIRAELEYLRSSAGFSSGAGEAT